ncbi:hypothetical protein M9H77_35240 [Catharanthus roseus]|uniref:Uncharacterized protein n=1 Tax=Catharanthus roseus TaxID=4058 RepID=A0ACB9ZNQ9_CATRO|nr:hypothetical protein M9H77_35240 [Catharanthus roseus]
MPGRAGPTRFARCDWDHYLNLSFSPPQDPFYTDCAIFLVDGASNCFIRHRIGLRGSRLKANAGAPTNFEVLDFLRSRGAKNAKSEILNIINIRPSSVVEIDPIIEECETRFGDSAEELFALVLFRGSSSYGSNVSSFKGIE